MIIGVAPLEAALPGAIVPVAIVAIIEAAVTAGVDPVPAVASSVVEVRVDVDTAVVKADGGAIVAAAVFVAPRLDEAAPLGAGLVLGAPSPGPDAVIVAPGVGARVPATYATPVRDLTREERRRDG